METIYLTTRNFYKKPNNVVDFQEYKRNLEQKEQMFRPMELDIPSVEVVESIEQPVSLFRRFADMMDAAASLALTVSAVFALMILI